MQTSSGEMMSLKLSRSSWSGNTISHVFGRFSSLMSDTEQTAAALLSLSHRHDAKRSHNHKRLSVSYEGFVMIVVKSDQRAQLFRLET